MMIVESIKNHGDEESHGQAQQHTDDGTTGVFLYRYLMDGLEGYELSLHAWSGQLQVAPIS